ncbi:PIN domain-like protein [Trichodelitschia bisporula]|uniref:PIN domain-like protein n=1 Tax=Trichodelitschia bisporula TaxID=703511 RepID=A0A6G1HVS4_9PEZI|nr:PIN domain-like protein [Trichodelitschia bisporula]
MGISGLLPLLQSIQKPCNLKDFSGQTIGVDAYGWLHRGTITCVVELATEKPTHKFVDFVMSKVRMLKHFGITPYMIFDGDYLPSKAGTEKERAARRLASKQVGLQKLHQGKLSEAHAELQKAIDVTPEMAALLIEELKRHGIPYIVAPYEADSQMAYMERNGFIDAILSEDSDLLVFGAKCLLTKLDKYGNCVMIRRDDFTACRGVSLVGWSDAEFRWMAILSGCDYHPGIDKLGLKTAHRLIRKHRTIDKVLKAIQFDGKLKMPPDYHKTFHQAESTFLYQWVFCPKLQSLLNHTPPGSDVNLEDMPYIGAYVEPEIAAGVARGELHPHTKKPLLVPTGFQNRPAPLTNRSFLATPKSKPIDTFFRPKRTPLAELDPNCFTPSPSQQHLLRRASGASWPATPIQPLREQPASVPALRRQVSTPLPQSPMRPPDSLPIPKCRRLCDDGSSLPVDEGSVKSKFFGRSAATGTPSRRSVSYSVATPTPDVGLWSDDSTEEAMLSIDVDTMVTAKSTPEADLLRSDCANASSSELEGDSQLTTSTMATSVNSQHSERCQLVRVPYAKEGSPEVADTASVRLRGFREKFSYSLSRQPDYLEVPRSPLRHSKRGADELPATRAPKALKREPSSVALGKQAVRRTPSSAPSKSRKPMDDIVDSDGVQPELDDGVWEAADAAIEVPVGDEVGPPTPKGCAVSYGKGSEDFLVSASEDEVESPVAPRRTLDLGRFAFVGK